MSAFFFYNLLFFNLLQGIFEVVHGIESFNFAGVNRLCDFGVHWEFAEDFEIEIFGDIIDFACAKEVDLLAAVRAFDIAHVFNDAQDFDVHLVCHLDSFFNYHRHEFLRGSDDDYAVQLDGLKHRERHVARSRRHIHKHIVHVIPHDVRPELFDHAGNDRAAPNDRIRLVVEEKVGGHNFHAKT